MGNNNRRGVLEMGNASPRHFVLILSFLMKNNLDMTGQKLANYKDLEKRTGYYDRKYSCGEMINTYWCNDNRYIYNYSEGLNLKEENAIELPTGIYKNENKDSEILVYKTSSPYLTFNINRPVCILNKGNVLQEIQRILIQFQQLNCTYSEYDLNDVYDEIALTIHHQTGLIPNYEEIKEETVRKAKEKFEATVQGMEINSVRDVVHELELGEWRHYFVYNGKEHDGRKLLLSAIKKHEKKINDAKINDCINNMMDAEMYINNQTIKDRLCKTGTKQIAAVFKERREEIERYNFDTFGVKSYKMYKKKYMNKC